ncbi:DNA repair exonuclease [Serendipita vermifera]|nr:DNA repair exonuclease [Serendipita vermifera]
MPQDDMEENRPATRISDRSPEDIIKIMLATDCHIGVHERDPIRGQDSINTFKEVLQLAVKHDVDMILLAGDLFHENRPSRESLYQTVALLREYTLGDKPVSIELLSNPDDGKAAGYDFPAINYEDPNLNVGIPVFSIHGNHDDPQGAGGAEGALCALDLLSVTGLVNYIGKMDIPHENENPDNTGIVIRPVLLGKGDTKLAMYGVGNVKDQRMHYQLRHNKIKMYTPHDKDDWFNIMLLHQNRVKRGGNPDNTIPEGMFDDSIDLIVWGHEHDCRIQPEEVAGKRYYITQPGSTVATSLADGESLTKHCALLEIQGKAFEITPIVLRTVRPFKMGTVILSEAADEENLNVNDRMEINTFLKRRINEMIVEATREFRERNADLGKAIPSMLPLIRLRVDTTGIPEMSNPQRLGLEFQGKIANPRDVIHFIRTKARNTKNIINQPELSIDQLDLNPKEKVDKVRVGQLVEEYLKAQEMRLLEPADMNEAIENYVEKEDSHAISMFLKGREKNARKGVPERDDLNEDEIVEALLATTGEREKEYNKEDENLNGAKSSGKERKPKEEDAASVDSMAMDEDDDIVPRASTAKVQAKGRATKSSSVASTSQKSGTKTRAKAPTTARGRGKKVIVEDSDEVEDFDVIMDVDEDEDDEEEEELPKPKKGRAKATPTPAKSTPVRKPAASKAKKAAQSTLTFAPTRSKQPPSGKMIDISSDSE